MANTKYVNDREYQEPVEDIQRHTDDVPVIKVDQIFDQPSDLIPLEQFPDRPLPEERPISGLEMVESIKNALAEARTIPEIKEIHDKAEAIRQYIKLTGESLAIQNMAAETKLRAERCIGEELVVMDKNAGAATPSHELGRPPKLSDLGITYTQSSRWQTIASIPETDFNLYIARTLADEDKELTTAGALALAAEIANSHVASSELDTDPTDGGDQPDPDEKLDGDEWYTPAKYIEMARQLMGDIDTDPASCDHAQQTVQAKTYFTKETDGLNQDWQGRVWINPPYSLPLIQQFTARLIQQYEDGITTEAVLLVNNCTDAEWFQNLLEVYPACFTKGRIKFERPDTDKFNTRQGQVFFYLGEREQRFNRIFSEIGTVVVHCDSISTDEYDEA